MNSWMSIIAPQRQAARIGTGLRDREAGAQQRVGTQTALVLGPVECDQHRVDVALVLRVHAQQGIGDVVVDRVDRLGDALAQIAILVAIAQFHRFVRTG